MNDLEPMREASIETDLFESSRIKNIGS